MGRYQWNNKNSWENSHTATNATIRHASALDNVMASGTFGGSSKGIGSGYGGMDALTAFQNIVNAHGFDEDPASFYSEDELVEMAEIALDLVGIPWENGIYDKDMDGIDFEEEIQVYLQIIGDQILEEWLSGDLWIPAEALEYAFYEISDHNW